MGIRPTIGGYSAGLFTMINQFERGSSEYGHIRGIVSDSPGRVRVSAGCEFSHLHTQRGCRVALLAHLTTSTSHLPPPLGEGDAFGILSVVNMVLFGLGGLLSFLLLARSLGVFRGRGDQTIRWSSYAGRV